MFTLKTKKESLADILSGFTTLKDKLTTFINSKDLEIEIIEAQIVELKQEQQESVADSEKAKSTLANISKLIGE